MNMPTGHRIGGVYITPSNARSAFFFFSRRGDRTNPRQQANRRQRRAAPKARQTGIVRFGFPKVPLFDRATFLYHASAARFAPFLRRARGAACGSVAAFDCRGLKHPAVFVGLFLLSLRLPIADCGNHRRFTGFISSAVRRLQAL